MRPKQRARRGREGGREGGKEEGREGGREGGRDIPVMLPCSSRSRTSVSLRVRMT